MERKYYYADGTSSDDWAIHKTLHRIDGPAIEQEGVSLYYIDGDLYGYRLYEDVIKEAKEMPLELRLIDPRWWVRELK